MNMPVPVGVIRAAVAGLLVAHDAQDARRIPLQHINNNHPNATARDSQTSCPGIAAVTSRRRTTGQATSHTSTEGWPTEALSTGK